MSDFDINQIRRLDGALLLVFRELLRRRRATEVADRLGLSPSAISHALTRLRDLFGDPLFIRRPHGLEPTRRALELGPKVENLLQVASATLGQERAFDPAGTERRFVISAPEFVSAQIGAPLIDLFARDAPRAQFVLVSLNQAAAMEGLRRGEVDLAVGRFDQPLSLGLTSEPLFEDVYCVVARRGHPRIDGAIDLATYCEAGLVLAVSTAETSPGEEVMPGRGAARVRAFVPRWLTVLVMVATTDAIGSCPRRFAASQADTLGLQVLDTPFEDGPFRVSLVRRADATDPALEWLEAQVRRAVG
jgi:DNA-binding transcriptional LysR family regulator